ncbi:hypothetical protein SBRCBS47491_009621 [Sporothrix bragantina]|uniref:Beta-mannosidase B n=1 Tax=Sporothrix bragantina TaxID=671064 RepID=A0ABP0CW68_9PEZI
MAFYQKRLSTGWTFKDADDDKTDAWMPVPVVPSSVQQDLIANNKLENPFIGFNELKAHWVHEKAWVYRLAFPQPAPEDMPAGARAALVFDGLDTFATVTLNGQTILKSDNMFVGHRVDITDALQSPQNQEHIQEHILEVRFDAADARACAIRAQHPEHKWIVFNGDTARLGVRKAQYHWGWDWGPHLMTAGIWREVRLEVHSARIADLWPKTTWLDVDSRVANITVLATIQASGWTDLTDLTASFRLSLGGHEIACQDNIPVTNTNANQTVTVEADFQVEDAQLWWPHGYGMQPLYEAAVSLFHRGTRTKTGTGTGTELHSASKTFGIRSAELIQQPDKHGKSFYFRINGVDVFCGGSCWIPADSFLPSIDAERYRKWIELMVAGGQVMIRVWGGGIYEDDAFYDACDQLGVLVWQDFMFGCGNYPVWPAMLDSLRQEAAYNLRRLRHHPSIVVYVGNNEDYQVQESAQLTYDFDDKDPANWLSSDFPARYIYEKLLPDAVAEYAAPGTVYHPGSPWGDGKPTSDATVGDMHQWNVWHGSQEKYQIFDTLGGRFNSEFGMEAFPHMATIDYFVEHAADRYPQSHVVDFHNKADGHERRLATYVTENLRRQTATSTNADFAAYIHLTQVVQAEAMMYAYRGWRRQWGEGDDSDDADASPSRRCGGALLWQLNDCWPTISWSIVDYFLRPKPAFYTVKRALAPLAVGVQRQHHDWSVAHAQPPATSTYALWIASSQPAPLVNANANVTVELRFCSVASGKDLRAPLVFENITVHPNGTTTVIADGDGVIDHRSEPEAHVLCARLLLDGQVVARDVDWPQPLKYLDLADRGLHITVEHQPNEQKQQVLRIRAQKPVKCLVFEERDGVRVSDSAMDIVPGDEQIVTVTGLGDGDAPLAYHYLGQDV